jgi:hypothetical protein
MLERDTLPPTNKRTCPTVSFGGRCKVRGPAEERMGWTRYREAAVGRVADDRREGVDAKIYSISNITDITQPGVWNVF